MSIEIRDLTPEPSGAAEGRFYSLVEIQIKMLFWPLPEERWRSLLALLVKLVLGLLHYVLWSPTCSKQMEKKRPRIETISPESTPEPAPRAKDKKTPDVEIFDGNAAKFKEFLSKLETYSRMRPESYQRRISMERFYIPP